LVPALQQVSKSFRSPSGYLLLRSDAERSELEVDRFRQSIEQHLDVAAQFEKE